LSTVETGKLQIIKKAELPLKRHSAFVVSLAWLSTQLRKNLDELRHFSQCKRSTD